MTRAEYVIKLRAQADAVSAGRILDRVRKFTVNIQTDPAYETIGAASIGIDESSPSFSVISVAIRDELHRRAPDIELVFDDDPR